MKSKVTFDIGGTFTDVVTFAEGHLYTHKVLSLLDRVGSDVASMARSRGSEVEVDRFIHATTICSNAIIENTVSKAGLLTTLGFRDTLEMRNQRGPSMLDLNGQRMPVLIPRERVLEVRERILADGSVAMPLDEDRTRASIEKLLEFDVEAIAVCLLHSYCNPSHEIRVGELINEMAPHVAVCLSASLQPEIREYERTSTAVVNASLTPIVEVYVDRLESQLREFRAPLVIMQSNGGIMTAEEAKKRPVLCVESGPAAGVLAAARLATEIGERNVLSFDMGGTTAKACLIVGGLPFERPVGVVGSAFSIDTNSRRLGHTIRAPMIDLVEVGAGGGSIAWADQGVLRVGPRSAGADPGPACYGRGGAHPTVTDANVVLGYINPTSIAGGEIAIDKAAAVDAVSRLGASIGVEGLPLAYGIVSIANSVMMRALRSVTSERGLDPRGSTMIAFGGSGGLHACALAEAVGITRVIIPPSSGVFTAMGLLFADYRIDKVYSTVTLIRDSLSRELLDIYRELEVSALTEMKMSGLDVSQARFERKIDVRYVYQLDEVSLDLPDVEPDALLDCISEAFEIIHERQFGYRGDAEKLLVNLRVRAICPVERPSFAQFNDHSNVAGSDLNYSRDSRDMYFGPQMGRISSAVRTRISITDEEQGPLVIEEDDTTIVVPPNWTVEDSPTGSLVLTLGQP